MTSVHDDRPIGVFDSGLGGLSVWREIARHLPAEETIYLADQAHVPYGPRSVAEIETFSHGIARFLLRQRAKLIVVACNTASGAALYSLRASFPDVAFVGMEPAVKPAAERTRKGCVGVIATPTTFEGDLYRRLVDRFGRLVDIHTQTCPGLVEAIEEGRTDEPGTVALIEGCLTPLLVSGVDQLVLGCTHYPFAQHVIERIVGPGVDIIDPAPAVARQVGRVLGDRRLLRSPAPGTAATPVRHVFYTTGDARIMQMRVQALVGYPCAATSCSWRDGEIDD